MSVQGASDPVPDPVRAQLDQALVLQALRRDWGWTGVDFAEILAISPMGHLVLADKADELHYLDPDLRQLLRLGSEEAARQFLDDPEVRLVWRAAKLVEAARERLGPTAPGEVYSLETNAMLRGDYAPENLVRMELAQLVSITGQVAYQTRDLPDGASFQLKASD